MSKSSVSAKFSLMRASLSSGAICTMMGGLFASPTAFSGGMRVDKRVSLSVEVQLHLSRAYGYRSESQSGPLNCACPERFLYLEYPVKPVTQPPLRSMEGLAADAAQKVGGAERPGGQLAPTTLAAATNCPAAAMYYLERGVNWAM